MAIAMPTAFCLSMGVGLAGLLAWDASTYSDRHIDRVPVDPLAVTPERGGKKNLKVAKVLVDDSDEKCVKSSKVQRLVIVGGGWGVSNILYHLASSSLDSPTARYDTDADPIVFTLQSVGLLKHLDPDLWHVTVVAPENYFLFHPLLRTQRALFAHPCRSVSAGAPFTDVGLARCVLSLLSIRHSGHGRGALSGRASQEDHCASQWALLAGQVRLRNARVDSTPCRIYSPVVCSSIRAGPSM